MPSGLAVGFASLNPPYRRRNGLRNTAGRMVPSIAWPPSFRAHVLDSGACARSKMRPCDRRHGLSSTKRSPDGATAKSRGSHPRISASLQCGLRSAAVGGRPSRRISERGSAQYAFAIAPYVALTHFRHPEVLATPDLSRGRRPVRGRSSFEGRFAATSG